MEYIVVTELEIDGESYNNFSSLTLYQPFRDHHKFVITFKLNDDFFVTSSDVDQFIGKSALIKFNKTIGPTSELVYEFYGYILEAQFEKKGTTYPEFTLIGYSNTIKLEQGSCKTFLNKTVDKIVDEIIANKIEYEVRLPDFCKGYILDYSAQYCETSFHYLRTLSLWAGYNMHYDGKKLHFGQPGVILIVDEASNYDLLSIRMNLKITPQTFLDHAYDAKDDKLMVSKSLKEVEHFGQNSKFLQSESHNFFSSAESATAQRVNITSQKVLDNIVKITQLARAADLQTISGTSHNPSIAIGRILRVIPPGGNYRGDKEETDYESYFITKVEHFTEDGNKYYNKFEGVPFRESESYFMEDGASVLEDRFESRKSYPQIATVVDNKDPEAKGRVGVQMNWQKEKNEFTNWIRVMTPDAGGGKDGAKNRGFVAIPEIGDQVMVDFELACPDAPFVMGGMFHGKSGGGGGAGNKIKSLTHVSGSTVRLDGNGIDIYDAVGNFIIIDGTNTIFIDASATISLKVGGTSLQITPSKIELVADHIYINGKSDVNIFSKVGQVFIGGDDISVKGVNASVHGNSQANLNGPKVKIDGDSEVKINGGTAVEVSGGMVKLNPK